MKKLAAFICETRPLTNLIQIIEDHLRFLPADTDLFIYHGRESRYIKMAFPNSHRREMVAMNERYYNEMLTDANFWSQFLNYEKVLIFQHDSEILRPGITEFLRMPVDYLGSPWKFPPFRGNGGLSLRTPKIMHEVCSQMVWNIGQGNEDLAICNYMNRNNIGTLATVEQCSKFACETIFQLDTWGAHAIDKHLTPAQCNQIRNQYK